MALLATSCRHCAWQMIKRSDPGEKAPGDGMRSERSSDVTPLLRVLADCDNGSE